MEFTEKHAELLGLHFGDGSLTKRKGTERLRFQLRGDAISDRAHYENFIIPLCNELIGFPVLGRPLCTVLDKKLNSFGVYAESNLLKSFFESLGVPIGVKKELKIPDWILQNPEFSKAFVRGLFDTDGGISFKRNNTAKSRLQKVCVVKIVSTSKCLMSDCSEILSSLAIKHYFKEWKKYNGEKNAFFVEVYKPHVEEFMQIIGSHNPKHFTKFQIWQKFGFCPSRTTPNQRELILKGFLNPVLLSKAGVP